MTDNPFDLVGAPGVRFSIKLRHVLRMAGRAVSTDEVRVAIRRLWPMTPDHQLRNTARRLSSMARNGEIERVDEATYQIKEPLCADDPLSAPPTTPSSPPGRACRTG